MKDPDDGIICMIVWLWQNSETHFKENVYSPAGLTTDDNQVRANLDNADDVIIVKSDDFEKTQANKYGCY